MSIIPINDGHINITLRVVINEQGDYRQFILQRINRSIFHKPELMLHSLNIVNRHLQNSDYPYEVLEIIPNLNQQLFTEDQNGDFWRMTKFISHTYCTTKVRDFSQAYEAAKTFSIFYSKLFTLSPKLIQASIPEFVNFKKRINDYKNALNHATEQRKHKASQALNFINHHLYLLESFIENQQNDYFPERIIHGDPKISNILFDNHTHKGRCVIDLDTLMPATLLYDFGDMVRSYTNLKDEDDTQPEDIFSPAYYEAVKTGFLSNTSDVLTPIEKDNLDYAGQVVVFIQAIRFVTDFLNGDIYYKIKYPNHNLNRTKNQINLLRELFKIKSVC
ncbi:phosphotransferase [Elizabethkingia argenteiflava]|uniref:phosphotransferase n=1 Tax=Elizabethkingia argenteiflava TaxID=2681556 RepID=UPI00293B8927|nr:phosphotransferase [Elizabethkingia argenteiflava]